MEHPLGRWAVIDIETTGLDSSYDKIIDIGFLQFEGTKLVTKFSSLVNQKTDLSYFIQKLTGINKEMLGEAPSWDSVLPQLLKLKDHHLIAHNAEFERSFLQEYFDEASDESTSQDLYEDSLFFLALLFPQMSSLSLESFICDLKVADKETHRGFEDSLDLLKVLLLSVKSCRLNKALSFLIDSLFKKYGLTEYWYTKFFDLSDEELDTIAKSIDFDLEKSLQAFEDSRKRAKIGPIDTSSDLETLANDDKVDLKFSGENIKEILNNEARIQKIIPAYTYRKIQEDLALRVGQCFKNNVHALVQAPTGTGKTLGYLLPAVLFGLNEKSQVLVSTGTKTLQQQIINKDAPQIKKILGLHSLDNDIKIKFLVGASNHLCELLFHLNLVDAEGDFASISASFDEKFVKMYFELVFYFNSTAPSAQSIIREKLPYVLKRKLKYFEQVEQDLKVDYRSCSGYKCPHRENCSYVNDLKEGKEADIIIGNHALMFHWPKSFGRPGYVVVDEAHKLEHNTTSAFQAEVTEESLKKLLNNLKHFYGIGPLFYLLSQTEESKGASTPVIEKIKEEITRVEQTLEGHLELLPDLVERFFKKMPKYTDTYWNELPMITKENQTDSLARPIFNHLESLSYIIEALHIFLNSYAERFDLKMLKGEQQIVAFTHFETFMGGLEDLMVDLKLSLEQKDDFANSIKYHETHGFGLVSSPINVGKILHEKLLSMSSSVFYTSATLCSAEGDMGAKGVEWVTGYLYLEPEKRFKSGLFLPPVYDYANKSKVMLCDDTRSFYDKDFVSSVLTPIIELIRNLKGRSLLLFSAKKRFEVARELLLQEFEGEIPLFIQGMGHNLIEEFKKVDGGILLGMESFGEGIDVPGDKLQFVFIDKVPDLRMDLVVQKRRDFYERNLGNEFYEYYMAHRARSLHQKLGRLLRTDTDFGGAIVVDSRIKNWKGGTLAKFFNLMQPYKIERKKLKDACQKIQEFIQEN